MRPCTIGYVDPSTLSPDAASALEAYNRLLKSEAVQEVGVSAPPAFPELYDPSPAVSPALPPHPPVQVIYTPPPASSLTGGALLAIGIGAWFLMRPARRRFA